MSNFGHMITSIIAGVIGLAAIAIIFSSNANTTNVLGSAFSGVSSILGAAEAPLGTSSSIL